MDLLGNPTLVLVSVALNAVLTIAVIVAGVAFAKFPKLMASHIKMARERRGSAFAATRLTKAKVVFLGDSITQEGEWHEYFPDLAVANRGISADTTKDVLERLDQVFALQPDIVCIMIGINDIQAQESADAIAARIAEIVQKLKGKIEGVQIILQSILPSNDRWMKAIDLSEIAALNGSMKELEKIEHVHWLDVSVLFAKADGKLDERYTNDGLHLNGEAYAKWLNLLEPILRDMLADERTSGDAHPA